MNKHSRLSLYYSFIHSYINYANVAWGSTYMTKLKKLIWDKENFEHTKQLFQANKILKVYWLNISNVATFIYKVNQKLLQTFLFQGFKNRLILSLLDSGNLTTYNRSTILKRVNTQFLLEDHMSGIAFLTPKREKSLLCINLKL